MVDLRDLEARLAPLSHSVEAIDIVRTACKSLPGTTERIALWNSTDALVRGPIQSEHAMELGFTHEDDAFVLLQGDIVRTESAYFMGERITGNSKYAVLNSSCDLVPDRSRYALLLRVAHISREDEQASGKISQLVKFHRKDSMYIPPLPDDPTDVVGNEVHFDGVCQIRQESLLVANRVASLSLLGWRIFGCFARNFIARANPREVEIRKAVGSAYS